MADLLDDLDMNIKQITYWLLVLVVLVIIFMSFLEKRNNRQDICHGRPALVIPFRFLDGYENRIAYAMAFGTTTNTIVSLVTSQQTIVYHFPLAVKALDVYLQAMIGCLTCFPLFACRTTRYKALGAVLCIVYSLWWVTVNGLETFQSVTGNSTSLLGVQFSVSDTITVDLAYSCRILQGLPIIFCYLVLIGYNVWILWDCYTSRTYITKGLESSVQPHQEEHVRWVLRNYQLQQSPNPGSKTRLNNLSSQTFVEQMRSSMKLRYFTNLPFFKYPTRVIALACIQLNVLYWYSLLLLAGTTSVLYLMIHAEFTKQFNSQLALNILIIISVCCGIAVIFSVTNALLQIFIGFRNYRLDMLCIYQGHKTFIPVRNETSQYILTRSMMFPGFQIAFMMWGIVVCFAAMLLMSLLPALLFYLFIELRILDDIAWQALQLLSFPLSVLVFFYLQVFITKLTLLQRKVKDTDKVLPLNVDNRKFYELLSYYSLFTNMAVGLFACLWRIAESAIIGTFSVGRLDRSVFTRENETADRGYAAYTSMLLVDNAHNNPCMRVFAHLLWTKTVAARVKQFASQEEMSERTALKMDHKIRYTSTDNMPAPEIPSTPDTKAGPWTFCELNGTRTSKKAETRWHLAYTLINNPQLCKHRKAATGKGALMTTVYIGRDYSEALA